MTERFYAKDFNTQELRRLAMVGVYETHVLEQRAKLGDAAISSMITVVQHHTPPVKKTATTEAAPISGSYEVLDGLTLPDTFEPAEITEAGYGDRLFFLGKDEAAPVINEEGKSYLIVNDRGHARKVQNTPRRINRLAKQGIKIQANPLARPHTKQLLSALTPNI